MAEALKIHDDGWYTVTHQTSRRVVRSSMQLASGRSALLAALPSLRIRPMTDSAPKLAEGSTTTVPAPTVTAAPVPVATGRVHTPPIERFLSHYESYNGPISVGENKTTHVASLRFEGGSDVGVVKAFPFSNSAWMNEAVAWTLGRALNISVPTKAMLLVADPSELASCTDPELNLAFTSMGSMGPIVFWCTGRLEVKPPQMMLTRSWESVALRGEAGQRIAALDGWIGNRDRHAGNAPYWVAKGVIAAIDHERMVYAQPWWNSPPEHKDRSGSGAAETALIGVLKKLKASGTLKPKQARDISAAISKFSNEHAGCFSSIKAEIEREILVNLATATGGTHLVKFLEDRATPSFISDRLEVK